MSAKDIKQKVLFSIYFEWACQDFQLLKANLGPLCMPHPGMGPLV